MHGRQHGGNRPYKVVIALRSSIQYIQNILSRNTICKKFLLSEAQVKNCKLA